MQILSWQEHPLNRSLTIDHQCCKENLCDQREKKMACKGTFQGLGASSYRVSKHPELVQAKVD